MAPPRQILVTQCRQDIGYHVQYIGWLIRKQSSRPTPGAEPNHFLFFIFIDSIYFWFFVFFFLF